MGAGSEGSCLRRQLPAPQALWLAGGWHSSRQACAAVRLSSKVPLEGKLIPKEVGKGRRGQSGKLKGLTGELKDGSLPLDPLPWVSTLQTWPPASGHALPSRVMGILSHLYFKSLDDLEAIILTLSLHGWVQIEAPPL